MEIIKVVILITFLLLKIYTNSVAIGISLLHWPLKLNGFNTHLNNSKISRLKIINKHIYEGNVRGKKSFNKNGQTLFNISKKWT